MKIIFKNFRPEEIKIIFFFYKPRGIWSKQGISTKRAKGKRTKNAFIIYHEDYGLNKIKCVEKSISKSLKIRKRLE